MYDVFERLARERRLALLFFGLIFAAACLIQMAAGLTPRHTPARPQENAPVQVSR